MPDYVYKGAYPMVYPAEIGNGFEITPAEGNPSTTGVGSTVVLYPLDVLHTTDPIPFHAWLQPEDGSGFADAVEDSEPVDPVDEPEPPVIPKASKTTIAANGPEVIIPAEVINPPDADKPVEGTETVDGESSESITEKPAEPTTSPENEETK